MNQYYIEEDFEAINDAYNFNDLRIVALNILKRIPQPIVFVCGPISTGGRGSPKENLTQIQKAIDYLTSKGFNVFNQVLLEDRVVYLDSEWKIKNTGEIYCKPILDEIFLPIFESGFIKSFYFLPDWQSSVGATWEREQAKRLNIEINDLPIDWEKGLLS